MNLDKNSWIFIGISAAICILIGFFLLWPGLANSWQTNKNTQTAKKELNEMSTKKTVLTDLSKSQNLTKLTATASGYIPEEPKSSELVLEISGIASQVAMTTEEISLDSTKPSTVAPEDDKTTPKTTESASSTPAEPSQTVDFKLKLSGTFENFQKFLQAVETSARLISIEKVNLSNDAEKFTAEIEGMAYWRKGISIEKSLANIAVNNDTIKMFLNLRQFGAPVNTSSEAGFGRTNPFQEIQ